MTARGALGAVDTFGPLQELFQSDIAAVGLPEGPGLAFKRKSGNELRDLLRLAGTAAA
jgi:hypothetical protein